MAKKKTKKKNTNIFLVLFSLVLFLISIICLFLKLVVLNINITDTFSINLGIYLNAFDIAFDSDKLSITGFLLIVFVFLSFIFTFLSLLKAKSKMLPILGMLTGVLSGIMFFSVNYHIEFSNINAMIKFGSLGTGAIIGGLTSLFGALFLIGAMVIKNEN